MPLAIFFHLFLLSEDLHRQPRAVYNFWVPCRACLSLRYLVPDCHLFAVLSTVDTIYVSLLWFLWEQRQVRTVLTVLVSRDSTDAVPGQGVLVLRCATTGAGSRPDIFVVAQRQFPMVHLFMLMVQFSDKVFDVVHSPFEWLDHRCHCNCRDLVLFVGRLPCCGGVSVAMSFGGGFTPGGCYDSVWDSVKPMTGKFIVYCFQYQEDVGCFGMLNGWFSSIDVICADNHNYIQFKLKGNGRSGAATQVVDVPVVQLHRCCSWFDGLTFLGRVHRYTARVPPPLGRGRGGGDAGSLLPGVLPPN